MESEIPANIVEPSSTQSHSRLHKSSHLIEILQSFLLEQNSNTLPLAQEVIIFQTFNGLQVCVEWKKNEELAFSNRYKEFKSKDKIYGPFITLINQYLPVLNQILVNYESGFLIFELFDSKTGGVLKPKRKNSAPAILLLDCWIEGQFLPVSQFTSLFQNHLPIPNIIFDGVINSEVIKSIKDNTLKGLDGFNALVRPKQTSQHYFIRTDNWFYASNKRVEKDAYRFFRKYLSAGYHPILFEKLKHFWLTCFDEQLVIAPQTTKTSLTLRDRTAKDLYTSEENYVKSLKSFIENLLNPIKEQNLMKSEEIGQLFNLINDIYQVHESHWNSLQIIFKDWNSNSTLGQFLLDWIPQLKVYSNYFNNYERLNLVVNSARSNSSQLSELIQQHFKQSGMEMKDYLSLPISRLPLYPILIKEILKNTSTNHSDFKLLERAYSLSGKLLESVDKASSNVVMMPDNKNASYSGVSTNSKRKSIRAVLFSNPLKTLRWKKNQRLIDEIAEETHLDKTWIRDVLETVFHVISSTSGEVVVLSESDFIHLFEGKLGPASVVKKLFKAFGGIGGVIGAKEFFHAIVTFETGSMESQLRTYFKALDEDNSGSLEFNEFKILRTHISSILTIKGTSTTHVNNIMAELTKLLDPTNSGSVSYENFKNTAEKYPNFINLIIPKPLIQLEHQTFLFKISNEHLNTETAATFRLIYNSDNDQDSIAIQLQKNDIHINALDWNQETMLHHAVIRDNLVLIKMLIQKGSDINLKYSTGITVLHAAAERGFIDSLRLLLKNGANINQQDDVGWTPLHRAIQAEKEEVGTGFWNCIIELITKGADLNTQDKDGCNCLHMAARYGQSEHLQFLVNRGGNVNSLSRNNFTPLHWAVTSGSAICVKKLISLGADINARTSTGTTPLHIAAATGNVNCIERLLEDRRTEVYPKDKFGRTPLHLAKDVRCTRLLLQQGPEALKIKDDKGLTPEEYAKQNGHTDALKVLREGPIQEQSEFSLQLLSSFRKGDNDKVLKLLKQPKVDVHACNENGTTLLHYAAMQGRDDILQILLSKGANPNIGNNRGTTPLHKAPQRGELKCLQVLLQAGANINVQDYEDVTPLHRALYELGTEKLSERKIQNIGACIKALIAAKAKLNLSDKNGFFPLDIAAKFGLVTYLEMLLRAGGDINHRSHRGYTPLHLACEGGHKDCVMMLISYGAHINDISETYPIPVLPPLHIAVVNNHANLVVELLRLGAKSNLSDVLGRTVLHLASWRGNPELIALFLARNPEQIKQTDKRGNIPLHFAGSSKAVKALVEFGSDVNAKNKNNDLPLHFVLMIHGDVNIIAKLLEYGSQINVENKFKDSPIYIALRFSLIDCLKLLRLQGAKFNKEENTAIIQYSSLEHKTFADELYPVVIKGTAAALINHLCQWTYPHKHFWNQFLITYRLFLNPQKLLECIIDFYYNNKEGCRSTEVYPEERNPKIFVAETGPLAVLKYWLANYFEDFASPSISDILLEFTRKIGESGKAIELIFSEQMERVIGAQSLIREDSLLSSSSGPRQIDLFKFSPEVIAQHLTTVCFYLFRKVQCNEYLLWNSTREFGVNSNEHSYLSDLMKRFSMESWWTVTEILSQKKRKDCAKFIQFMIAIAKACFDLNNFQSCKAIILGLESPSISRLKKIWKRVGSKSTTVLRNLADIFQPEGNYKKYRQHLEQCKGQSCIPYVGVSLSDLANLDETVSSIEIEGENQLINFTKMKSYASIVQSIQVFHSSTFNFTSDPELTSYLAQLHAIEEKEALELSTQLEAPV